MLTNRFQYLEKQAFILAALFLTFAGLTIFSCRNAAEVPTLRVALPTTTLRDAPGERGREIRILNAGDRLTDLGVVSTFESQFRIAEQSLIAPWLQVRTVQGETGWVFSGAVLPIQPDDNWLLDKRLRCYFGEDLTLRRNRWWATRTNVTDETNFSVFYHEALALRDTFTYHLAHRSEPNNTEVRPDFFWLREALPGFVFQRVDQGTQPYLFADYRFFQKLAAQSTGYQDDQWITACLAAYPTDSIESNAPVWTMPVNTEQVVSQLGLGKHWEMLKIIDTGLQRPNGLFQADFLQLKEEVLEDILGKNVRYWQPVEKILAELNKIAGSQFISLTPADRAALERRLVIFEDPAANGVPVNLRAGE